MKQRCGNSNLSRRLEISSCSDRVKVDDFKYLRSIIQSIGQCRGAEERAGRVVWVGMSDIRRQSEREDLRDGSETSYDGWLEGSDTKTGS